jgi:hypothetical protein
LRPSPKHFCRLQPGEIFATFSLDQPNQAVHLRGVSDVIAADK